ncbi:MAG: hypothetical protein A3H98_08710 [Bacteroidetes bacterium RIFCSPLOWO2_02_FULL_36_8]|nr:MAG: hypothetical protein A3H98_08710 [Bacteroidetes bacterium RIFCSPLOWO2_02_FULL_36_8]OFY70923.1 MAG: hypothetical protein A3G23_12445 [Bacteroidetes bacterium RIFCSPLOWO2_12_FULL_37_12]
MVESLLKYPIEGAFEILIYDNASHPEEFKKLDVNLKNTGSSIISIYHGNKNTGYGTAMNRLAIQAKGKHFMLLNNDTFFKENKLKEFYNEYLKRGASQILSCRVVNQIGAVQNKGCYFHLLSSKIKELVSLFFPNVFKPDYYPACCWLISQHNFFHINGFDETYFMYGEDADFALRAKKKGIRNLLSGEGEIVHDYSKTNQICLFRYLLLHFQGKKLFMRKNCTGIVRILLWTVSLMHSLLRIATLTGGKKHRALVKLYVRGW